jgi:hypothetical protein
MAGKVEGEYLTAWIPAAKRLERRLPHRPVERQPVQKDKRRPGVGLALDVAGETSVRWCGASRPGAPRYQRARAVDGVHDLSSSFDTA